MNADTLMPSSQARPAAPARPLFVTGVSLLVGSGALGGAVAIATRSWGGAGTARLEGLLGAIVILMLGVALFHGLWTLRRWARSAAIWLLVLGLVYFLSGLVFEVSAQVFGGEQALSLGEIARFVLLGLLKAVLGGCIPGGIIFGLIKLDSSFDESPAQRAFADRAIRYVLGASALSAIFIVFLIVVFTLQAAWPAIAQNGVGQMLVGTIWRPTDQQFGVLPMLVGSVLSTLGAIVLGVPLSLGTAILLAEIAPRSVREVIHPAVELLAGIPSVVYGLFGMVVLAPFIRGIELPYNSGFGLLNASVILAVMILPTVATVSEDAIRAVPRYYKEGALALGATHWQAIHRVILRAASSGILAAVMLGIGRVIGETMAVMMITGNAAVMPKSIVEPVRTLTATVAAEMGEAVVGSEHYFALFGIGIVLFIISFAINVTADLFLHKRQ